MPPKRPAAAAALENHAADLLQLGVVDLVLALKPSGGNHWQPVQAANTLA